MSYTFSFILEFIYVTTIKNAWEKKRNIRLLLIADPYNDDDLKVKTQRPRSADQPGVFQAQTGEYCGVCMSSQPGTEVPNLTFDVYVCVTKNKEFLHIIMIHLPSEAWLHSRTAVVGHSHVWICKRVCVRL